MDVTLNQLQMLVVEMLKTLVQSLRLLSVKFPTNGRSSKRSLRQTAKEEGFDDRYSYASKINENLEIL
jgi:hypothetical protein